MSPELKSKEISQPPKDYVIDNLRFTLWIESVRRKIRHDMDEMVLVAGPPGRGKSTLSYLLGMVLDETFDHTRIAMEGESFIDILEECPQYGVAINDEPVEGLFSREHSSKPNKAFARWSWIMRGRNLIMIINANEIRWMDPMVRDSRANWVWHIKDHGYAVLYKAHRPDDLWAEGTQWIPLFAITYPKITPDMIPDWKAYQIMKNNRLFKTNVRRKKQIGDAKQEVEKEKKPITKPCHVCGSPERKTRQGCYVKNTYIRMCGDCKIEHLDFKLENGKKSIHPKILEKLEEIKEERKIENR